MLHPTNLTAKTAPMDSVELRSTLPVRVFHILKSMLSNYRLSKSVLAKDTIIMEIWLVNTSCQQTRSCHASSTFPDVRHTLSEIPNQKDEDQVSLDIDNPYEATFTAVGHDHCLLVHNYFYSKRYSFWIQGSTSQISPSSSISAHETDETPNLFLVAVVAPLNFGEWTCTC